ncbi:MAG: M20/M25/M40 family metallo-hydrolase, partial [Cyanobacteria bacterium HKST-UBA01]|nr:M20/M25/M40 family metallo-hydrolase [Cyanobacteria bacterium HKST-UBA01]
LLSDLLKSSMLRNTISLTVMKAGYKTNVIPASASAQLDCRLLPDVKKDEFIKWIKGIIDDPTVKISVLEWNQSDPSSMETEMVAAIKKVAAAEDAKVPVVPVIVPWFTDSHWFRELGVQAYGFQPCEVDKEHFATMHGKDERISIDSFKKGVVRMYKILKEVAAADAK